jgi:hypothetical protein
MIYALKIFTLKKKEERLGSDSRSRVKPSIKSPVLKRKKEKKEGRKEGRKRGREGEKVGKEKKKKRKKRKRKERQETNHVLSKNECAILYVNYNLSKILQFYTVWT